MNLRKKQRTKRVKVSRDVVYRAAKLSPETPEARDEGPRLIPLANIILPVLPDHSRYLAMADEALRKPRASRRNKS